MTYLDNVSRPLEKADLRVSIARRAVALDLREKTDP